MMDSLPLICDINKSHRFRIRQLMNGAYHIITNEGKDGWIRNNVIKGINEYNDINIKTNGSDHDIFINGSLVYSFRIENLEAGSFGILIGPETKGRIDYFNIYADELYRDKSKIYLSDDEIRDLIKENDDLKIKLEQSLDARALELENAIRILENQLKTMRLVNEQLDKENSQYAIIKSAIDTNQVDLLIDLSHKVINKTLENRQLKIENKLMTDSLKSVKMNFENLEVELFQKVIDKKIEEQQFIDSILVKFCQIDSLSNQSKPFLKDSLIRSDSLLIETPKHKQNNMSVQKKNFKRITTNVLQEMKRDGERISMLTAYDFTMAKMVDDAGIDVILVGDSASNVMAGHETTLPITLDQMIYHASSVIRAIYRALVVVDLPDLGHIKETLKKL